MFVGKGKPPFRSICGPARCRLTTISLHATGDHRGAKCRIGEKDAEWEIGSFSDVEIQAVKEQIEIGAPDGAERRRKLPGGAHC